MECCEEVCTFVVTQRFSFWAFLVHIVTGKLILLYFDASANNLLFLNSLEKPSKLRL